MSVLIIVAKPEDADELARVLKDFLTKEKESVIVQWGTAEAMQSELKGGVFVNVTPLLQSLARAINRHL